MHHLPEIAIIEPNTLTALGLRTILEELIPEAVIRTFLLLKTDRRYTRHVCTLFCVGQCVF